MSELVRKVKREPEKYGVTVGTCFFTRDKISKEEVTAKTYEVQWANLSMATVHKPCLQSDGLPFPSMLTQADGARFMYNSFSDVVMDCKDKSGSDKFQYSNAIEIPSWGSIKNRRAEFVFQESLSKSDNEIFSTVLFSYLKYTELPSFMLNRNDLRRWFKLLDVPMFGNNIDNVFQLFDEHKKRIDK